MEFKADGGELLCVVSDDLPFLLAELDPSETKQQAAPGSDPELRKFHWLYQSPYPANF